MQPIDFPQANKTFTKPEGWTDEECSPLHVQVTDEALISKWMPDESERARIAEGAPVTLSIFGRSHPPVMVSVPCNDCENKGSGCEAKAQAGSVEAMAKKLTREENRLAFIGYLYAKAETSYLKRREAFVIIQATLVEMLDATLPGLQAEADKIEPGTVAHANALLMVEIAKGFRDEAIIGVEQAMKVDGSKILRVVPT